MNIHQLQNQHIIITSGCCSSSKRKITIKLSLPSRLILCNPSNKNFRTDNVYKELIQLISKNNQPIEQANKITSQMIQLKNRQRNWKDGFTKKTPKWSTGIWKVLNITYHQRNTNQKHNELSSHTHWNGNHYTSFMPSEISQLGKDKYCMVSLIQGLFWWLSDKESACQCRRCGFDRWVGKISWRKK